MLDFTRLFGDPDPHILQQFALPGFPDIVVLSNIVENGRALGNRKEGFGWHTDLTYMAQPAAYTILYGLEVPPEGGDTLFASLYKAYEALDDAEKEANCVRCKGAPQLSDPLQQPRKQNAADVPSNVPARPT